MGLSLFQAHAIPCPPKHSLMSLCRAFSIVLILVPFVLLGRYPLEKTWQSHCLHLAVREPRRFSCIVRRVKTSEEQAEHWEPRPCLCSQCRRCCSL